MRILDPDDPLTDAIFEALQFDLDELTPDEQHATMLFQSHIEGIFSYES